MSVLERWAFLCFLCICLPACSREFVSEPSAAAAKDDSQLPGILRGSDRPGIWRPAACPFALPDDLIQGQDVECGYLPVYETPGDKEGRVIRLAVAIFHPPGGAVYDDPVIYLSGGPGVSVLKEFRYQYEMMSAPVFAVGRSLVVFDQRGVGLSQPALNCPEFNQLSRELNALQSDGQVVEADSAAEMALKSLQACRVRLSQVSDLSAYHSENSAADIYELVNALNYDSINLWGGSYGTRLALEVMREYPQILRSVVLDAVYPPDVDLFVQSPGNLDRALKALFDACATNSVCNNENPDLERVFFDTIDELNRNPVLREIEDPFIGEEYSILIDGDMLLTFSFQLLYDSHLRYFIPQIIYDASRGEFNYMEKVYISMLNLSYLSSRGMMLSVQCHEEAPFSTSDQYSDMLARYPELKGMFQYSIMGGLIYRTCEIWDAGQAGERANQAVVSDLPALILTGEFDPVTPPDWGFHAAETLSRSYAYEYPGIGHGASIVHSCPMSMLTDFWQNPANEPDDSCIQNMK